MEARYVSQREAKASYEEGSNGGTERNVYRGASLFVIVTKYYVRDQITTMRWAENIAHVTTKDVFRILVGESERKGALGKPRHRWEYHIQTDSIHLAQDRGMLRGFYEQVATRGVTWLGL
jgi:hypothetical protein